MSSSQNASLPEGDHEFHFFLIGSILFYTLLVFLVYRLPIENSRPASPKYSPPRKITMAIPSPPIKPKPLPPVQPEIKKTPPRPIVPKKAEKFSPPPAVQPKENPQPPSESPEEAARKEQERLALQRARELEKNREIAKNKLASLFGNTTDEVLQNKGANVITSAKSGSHPVKKGYPAGDSSGDLQINSQGIDQILKKLPGGESGKDATLGEHQTKVLSRQGEGNGIGGKGAAGSARTPDEVEQTFKAYEGRLRAYYDRILQTRPDLKGKMTVKMIIAADGHVIQCKVLSSHLGDKNFENEIAQIIQDQFKFSKIFQGEESFDKVLIFQPIK
ncbi:MAG: AgmX/PglI C-terminal domain-containing protein [Nitrospiria bacterium]